MASEYTDEERNALAGMFSMFDPEGTGFVEANELGSILQRIGRDPEQAAQIADSVDEVTQGRGDGKVSFEEFLELLARGSAGLDVGDEAADPKVLEFLNILDEYRLKCEDEGNYLEAGRANAQLELLRKQEERRQQK
jgi:Ca2+-binding EF-hand superfamily protein